MSIIRVEIIQSVMVIVISLLLVQVVKSLLKKIILTKKMDKNRKKVILNLIYLLFYITVLLILMLIWGIELRQFTVFISSILAVLGVGFFAQWSILSNLTSSVILFFNHPLRIGDRIRILDKDFNWTGKVTDLTGFYLFMKTDNDEYITIPTSLLMQKGIEILESAESS